MGNLLLKQGKNDEAVTYFTKALNMLTQMGDIYNESHTRLGLYRALKDSDPKTAMLHMERYKALKDSIYDRDASMSLAMANAQIGNDALRDKNAALNKTVIYSIVLIALLIIAALALWIWARQRQRRAIEENRRLNERLAQLSSEYRQLNNRLTDVLSTRKKVNDDVKASATNTPVVSNEFLDKVVVAINGLIDTKQISADAVAMKLNMSTYQLRERLRELTGDTPQALIQAIRMNRACNMLDNDPLITITEVAEACAYGDASNFTRAFKKVYGITPKQYIAKTAK